MFDKNTSLDDDATLINDPDHNVSDFSKTTNENTGQFGVHTVSESSVLHVSILFLRHKRKKARNRKTVAGQREREEREGFLISVAKSMSMKSRRNSIILYRLTENSILMTDSSEDIFVQAVLRRNSVQRNFSRMSTRWRSRIWIEEIQNMRWLSHSVSLNLKDNNIANQWGRSSSTWENMFV